MLRSFLFWSWRALKRLVWSPFPAYDFMTRCKSEEDWMFARTVAELVKRGYAGDDMALIRLQHLLKARTYGDRTQQIYAAFHEIGVTESNLEAFMNKPL